ncbi:hypothetical protein JNUCC64_16455 [Streptomyces sp. JNUCC 64]
MAQNPQAPQGPQGGNDPAGSTQMFRAFVDEGGPSSRGSARRAARSSGPRLGLVLGVVAGIAVLAGVVWLALA